MNTKAAILLVALMALMASSQAISTDEKQKITKDTAPLTIATESVFVDAGNRKMAMMVLRDGLLCDGVFINGRCVQSAPAENCVPEGDRCTSKSDCCDGFGCDGILVGVCRRYKGCVPEGNPCGALDWCCDGFYCDSSFPGFNGNCKRQGLPTPLSSIV